MKARWMIICGSSGSLRRQDEPSVKRLPMGWSSSSFIVCEPRLSILSVTSMNLPSAWRERGARTEAAKTRERAQGGRGNGEKHEIWCAVRATGRRLGREGIKSISQLEPRYNWAKRERFQMKMTALYGRSPWSSAQPLEKDRF